MTEYNINQISSSSVETDDDGIAYVELTVTTLNPRDEVTLRMNAAQAGIAASALRHRKRDARNILEDNGEALRTIDAVLPTYPDTDG